MEQAGKFAPSTVHKGIILIIDDQPENLRLLSNILVGDGYIVHPAVTGTLALNWLKNNTPDLILLDIKLPDINGYEVCRELQKDQAMKSVPIIFISALNEHHNIVKGFDYGGVDYVCKPLQVAEVLARVRTHVKLRRMQKKLQSSYDEIKLLEARLRKENAYLRKEVELNHKHSEIVGESKVMQDVLHKVEEVAALPSTVLLLGETGTGKGLISEAIHRLSDRGQRVMVKVNCAALAPSLIEAELFGSVKGAFTGSTDKQTGRFELADGSTLFLDEIGELPLELQAKLLRVLQEGEFERLGSSQTVKTNVRIIAATNRNLEKEVKERRFRSDLYYRLNVYPIRIPALRERRQDIPKLIWRFVEEMSANMGRQVEKIPGHEMQRASELDWPGNIRELANMVERSLISCQSTLLHLDLPKLSGPLEPLEHMTLEMVEKQYIEKTMKRTQWRIRGDQGAAQQLGVKPTTLEAKMARLGIVRPS